MWLHSFLASWKAGLSRRRRPQPRPARPRGFRPCLEALEDRCVPSTLNVTSNADTGAVGTLRWAVGVANANPAGLDTIDILTTKPIALTQGQLLLGGARTIEATAGTATISGNGLSRVFQVNDGGAVTLEDLNITGGNAGAGNGGGILMNFGLLTVTNCTLSGNSASSGGAIANDGGFLTVTNCTLSGNSAAVDGGAIYSVFNRLGGPYDRDGLLRITDCTLSGNSAEYGGAIAVSAPISLVNGCAFSDNSASVQGGAIAGLTDGPFYIYTSSWRTIRISSCTFAGNTPDSVYAGQGEST